MTTYGTMAALSLAAPCLHHLGGHGGGSDLHGGVLATPTGLHNNQSLEPASGDTPPPETTDHRADHAPSHEDDSSEGGGGCTCLGTCVAGTGLAGPLVAPTHLAWVAAGSSPAPERGASEPVVRPTRYLIAFPNPPPIIPT